VVAATWFFGGITVGLALRDEQNRREKYAKQRQIDEIRRTTSVQTFTASIDPFTTTTTTTTMTEPPQHVKSVIKEKLGCFDYSTDDLEHPEVTKFLERLEKAPDGGEI
jgi:hypothetical protein